MHYAWKERSVGTTAGRIRRPEILDVGCGVPRNRFENPFPLALVGATFGST